MTRNLRLHIAAVAFVVAGGVGFAGCDGLGSGLESPDYVLESYVVANEPFRVVRLSRTAGVGDQYNFDDLAETGATVTIELLDSAGNVESQIPYEQNGNLYFPVDRSVIALPSREYRLAVTTASGDLVSAKTIVPGEFDVQSVNTTSVVYQGPDQIAIDVSRSVYPGRQTIFVFSVEASDPTFANLTPLYAEFIDVTDETDDTELDDVRITESPPINELNYDENADGSLTIRLPWIAVAFYGENRIIASAIDDNMFDFVRSHNIQQGGSTLSPGEIPNVIDHVEGGTGVFGSFSQQSVVATITDPTGG